MSAPNKIGFAVVGLGAIAQGSILPAFANCRNAMLAAVVSRDREKAGRIARQFSVPHYYSTDDFAACLANPAITAVYIATPQGEHAEYTIRAANAGKHVLCEKPLAATPDQSRRMVAACEQGGVLLMTAYRKYFEPSSRYLKELVQSGELGRLDMIHTSFSELPSPGATAGWLLDSKLAGGGPLMDLGVYCVNTCRWIAGEDPCKVRAEAWCHRPELFQEVEEGISFQMQFPSGLVVQGSTTYSAAMSSFIFIQGTRGWVMLTPAYPYEDERLVTGKINGHAVSRKFEALDEFALEIDAFASAIRGHGTVEPDGAQGHRDMIILAAIYEAARTQQAIDVNY